MITLSSKLSLPNDAVTQKIAILGRTGSGKSYCATKIAEEMLDNKSQIVALDPVGVWYGLRTGHLIIDGKPPPGFNVPIFGGLHGDMPLEPTAGELIANLIVDRSISAILDVSQFESDAQKARFAEAFATRFFFRKKSSPSAVHLFLEESQEFVPQNPQRNETGMLHAFHRLIKLGRNFGIGATLISQRPQEVNKKALNQTELLLAFQMTGPQERKAIESWIMEKGVDEDIREVLPHLQVGQCHVWSPQWLRVSETIKIGKKKTADVSSTPEAGVVKAEPRPLTEKEMASLSDQMKATIERAKADDPKELRRRIKELEGQVGRREVLVKTKTYEVPILTDQQIGRVQGIFEGAQKLAPEIDERIRRSADHLTIALQKCLVDPLSQALKLGDRRVPDYKVRDAHGEGPKVDVIKQANRDTNQLVKHVEGGGIKQQILDSLAWWEASGVTSPSRRQVAFVAKYKVGGYFNRNVSNMRTEGLIEYRDGGMALTQEGRKQAKVPTTIMDRDTLLRNTREVIDSEIQRKLFDVLAENDRVLSRGHLAELAGYEVGGYFNRNVSALKSAGIVAYRDGGVGLDEMFDRV